jgi:hypothetical protein
MSCTCTLYINNLCELGACVGVGMPYLITSHKPASLYSQKGLISEIQAAAAHTGKRRTADMTCGALRNGRSAAIGEKLGACPPRFETAWPMRFPSIQTRILCKYITTHRRTCHIGM